MLAKAVATECQTTFFNISASTLVSKWRGDSEKLVRVLFEVARYHSPSTIFLDEIDSILGARGGDGGQEHEASRRMKTELLIQMDGVKSSSTLGGGSNVTGREQLFVMAASNLPWDLDMAVLRRLEKRVLVPLPESEAREAMIRKHLQDRVVPEFAFKEIADSCVGFSGADIELLCREAAMMPVRRLMEKLHAIGRMMDL
jgi:katanin p60 ATPase-containing subunit A1